MNVCTLSPIWEHISKALGNHPWEKCPVIGHIKVSLARCDESMEICLRSTSVNQFQNWHIYDFKLLYSFLSQHQAHKHGTIKYIKLSRLWGFLGTPFWTFHPASRNVKHLPAYHVITFHNKLICALKLALVTSNTASISNVKLWFCSLWKHVSFNSLTA